MWGRKTSGLIGMVVGGAWLASNLQYFEKQGFTAIGMPIIILVLGTIYFFTARSEDAE